jgi:tetratricopeptide (TPR) repeat protein
MALGGATDLDDVSIAAALERLEAAGLLNQRHFLHPSVGGRIRGDASLTVRDKDFDAFVDVMADYMRVVGPGEKPLVISVGTLRIAMDRLLVVGRMHEAIAVSNLISSEYARRGDLREAVAVQRRLLSDVGTAHSNDARVAALLSAIEVAIASSDSDSAEVWLAEVAAAPGHDAATKAGRILYYRGKLAELRGDLGSYRSLLHEALEELDAPEDDELIRSIAGQLSATSLRTDGPDGEDGKTGYLAGSAQDLRAQAQHWIASDDLVQARRLLDRAIAIDTRDGNLIGKAMNVSLRADVLSRSGDLETARTSFEEAVAIFEQAGDRRSAAISYHQWGKAAYNHGLDEEARYQFILSARTFADIGDVATLEIITGNFEQFLDGLDPVLKGMFSLKWTSAGLPTTDAIRDSSIELLAQMKTEE